MERSCAVVDPGSGGAGQATPVQLTLTLTLQSVDPSIRCMPAPIGAVRGLRSISDHIVHRHVSSGEKRPLGTATAAPDRRHAGAVTSPARKPIALLLLGVHAVYS